MSVKRIDRVARDIFRYYPPFCALLMLHHVIALIFGYDTCIHEFLVDGCLIAAIMQWILSIAYRFCIWHKACILYTYLVSVCISYQRNIGFGEFRDTFRYIVVGIGFTILAMFVAKCVRNRNQQPHQLLKDEA